VSGYRVGQRVRIEWPEGSAVEGSLTACGCCDGCDEPILVIAHVGKADHHFWADPTIDDDGRTVTVLAEPRPDEPTGLGAVVEASSRNADRRRWVRLEDERDPWYWADSLGWECVSWNRLVDPVILSQGWSE